MLLLSTLVAELLLFVLTFTTGAAVGLSSAWLQRRRPWLPSNLPQSESLADCSWDEAALGWWTEPPIWFPSHREGETTFVLPAGAELISLEEVSRGELSIWHFIEGARV